MTRASLILSLSLLVPSLGEAQACFTVEGASGGNAQQLVGLDAAVRLSRDCRYGLSTDGPQRPAGELPAALFAGEVDFLTVVGLLAGEGSEAQSDPRVIYAEAGGARQTLMLRYCAHYLLEEQLGFRAVPPVEGGGLRLERVRAPECGAERVELRAAEGASQPRLLLAGAGPHVLAVGQRSLELPQGEWSIFAARPGGAVGLRVGVFRSQRTVTPLSNHLRAAREGNARPLFAARWAPGGPGMLLHPTAEAARTSLLWPELRTAADAGFLWFANTAGRIEGLVQLEAEPAAVRIPDTAVRQVMQRRYGDASGALAPNAEDWAAILDQLSLCVTPSYHAPVRPTIGAASPAAASCAAMRGLTVLAQATQPPSPARVCIRRGMQELGADGVTQTLEGEPSCIPLPAVGSEERMPFTMLVAGDRVRVEGEGLCVLLDDRPIAPGDDGEITLRSGLLELRQGGGSQCTDRQALSRVRLPVVDPERDWHPVGLYTGQSEDAMRCGDDGGTCPWRALAHDESDRFAFVEPRHELTFSLTTSPQVAAAINGDAAAPVQVTRDVPLLSGVTGDLEGGRPAALVAYASREAECPADVPLGDLRARPPVDPDDLLADATFHVFLLAVGRDDEPARCTARASFRVRPSRALVAETVADFLGLEVGVLGDTQVAVFANDPLAMGLMLPVAWLRVTPGIRFISLEITGSLTMAAAFSPAEVSRLGAALTWAISFGIPEYLPRILSVGGALHGAAATSTIDNPLVSFFVGLNLSTLVDLAGGR